MLVLGAIELGRAIMVQQSLVTAARAGARLYGLTSKATVADVNTIVDTVMARASITGYTVTLDPPSTVGLDPLAPVSISVSVPYNQVAWLPANWLTNGVTLTGKCTMPVDPGL
jgi:Flp pilus assembly protein TadG